MAQKVIAANQLVNLELAYEGYDPNWIIGTQGDPLPHWSYGPYAAAAKNRMLVNQSQSLYEDSHRGFFNMYDPHRRMATSSYYGRGPPGPQIVVPGPSGPVVKAAKVVPAPMVTTVIYPHGHGHNLGTGHGFKNIVIMRIPDCCYGCEEKWKDRLTDVPGFRGVNVDRHGGNTLRATVFGDMDTHSVVRAIQKVQPRAEFWGGGIR